MINFGRYIGLYAGYGAGALVWLIALRTMPSLWPSDQHSGITFTKPWREVLWALLACLGVVAVGQAYQHGFRLPVHGSWGTLAESINQVMVFSPVVLLLALRRQGLSTAWLPTKRIPERLAVGVAVSLAALVAYCMVREQFGRFGVFLARIFAPGNADKAVQVFLEDLSIAVVMCRLTTAMKHPWRSAGLVGALFAAGHIPAMLSHGVAGGELVGLVLDGLLGLFMVRILQRAGDIWWFWCLHFMMDMTQFM